MSTSLASLLVTYKAQRLELYDGKSLLESYTGTGGDLEANIKNFGIQPFFSHLLFGQKLLLISNEVSICIQHKSTYYHVLHHQAEEVRMDIIIPVFTPLHLAPEESEATSTLDDAHVGDSEPSTLSLDSASENSLSVARQDIKEKAKIFGAEFAAFFGTKDAYVAGAMAGGIASVELVEAMSKHGRLAFFGSGGLSNSDVEKALFRLASLRTPFGCNVLCNLHQPQEEERLIDLLLSNGVRIVSASAYSQLTPALVRYRLHGIFQDESGTVIVPNRIIAKLSHPTVASQFLAPPSEKIIAYLLKNNAITSEEARLSSSILMADSITVEADSGGHTDSRPLSVIFPSIKKMAQQVPHKVFVGAAGGIGTPQAMASAAVLGADYLLIGSPHQSCLEAGTSDLVKAMLCKAKITDMDMGIAPDMFERGAKVQVLTAGSLYAPRSRKLRELYLQYNSWDEIPESERKKIESLLFRASYEEIWDKTVRYWNEHDPHQIARSERIPKHKLALVFRWYLGQSSRWARLGVEDRKQDFQIWCGPSMGAFNEWAEENGFSSPQSRNICALSDALWEQFCSLLSLL